MKPYIVLCVFLMVQVCEASEPYCRQYEYDEKMLTGPIGFTVKNPDKTKSSNKIAIFKDVITNEGDGFNKGTGKFKCKHPGLYYFSVVISRRTGSTSQAHCYIMVNDKNTIIAYAHSKDSGTSPSGSANLLVQLVEGDEVYLGLCYGIDRIEVNTHFSGFLVN